MSKLTSVLILVNFTLSKDLKFKYFKLYPKSFQTFKPNYHFLTAYFLVHSEALPSAAFLFVFQCSAASLFKGSSGLGSFSKL